MTSPMLASLLDDIRLGSTRARGARHRELRRPEVVERMAERVDAIAVDVGHRAGGAELEVAAQQRDADGVARLERRPSRRAPPRAGWRRRRHRHEAGRRERRRERVEHLRLEARCRPAAWRSAAASALMRRQVGGRRRDRTGAVATVRKRTVRARRDRATQLVEQLARRQAGATSRPRRVCARRGRIVVASVISSIGVMPAIGSFENCPSEYETAPISRPSM